MHLTYHTDYSLRLLMYLSAHQERFVSTTEVSNAYGISKNHLVRVAQTLAHSGFIKIVSGRYGGIKLARSPKEISLGEVVRTTEVNFHLVECFDKKQNSCPITPVCSLKALLQDAMNAFLKTLDGYTLMDLMNDETKTHFAQYVNLRHKQTDNRV